VQITNIFSYQTGNYLQILQTASINSARVLINAVSLRSFSLIIRHTFSIIFKSGD